MIVQLFMSDGRQRDYEVSDKTFRKMEADFEQHEKIKFYPILPSGRARVDWTEVDSIRGGGDPNPLLGVF